MTFWHCAFYFCPACKGSKTSRPVPFLSSSEFAFVDIFGVNEDAEPGEKKARVREILLRWHPEDRESVREGVLWMSQRINELKNR